MSRQRNHLKALLRKNWIIWKRNKCCSCFEILMPFIICISIMALFRSNIDKTMMPETSYFDKPESIAKLYSTIPTGVFNGGSEIIPPLLNCLTRTWEGSESGFRNGYVALAPKTSTIIDDLETMLQNVYNYPTRRYDTLDQLFEYTTNKNYDWDVCFAV